MTNLQWFYSSYRAWQRGLHQCFSGMLNIFSFFYDLIFSGLHYYFILIEMLIFISIFSFLYKVYGWYR